MIRKALLGDAQSIAPLIVQAMGFLAFKFSNTTDYERTCSLFEHFIGQAQNQYSYQNTWVFEKEKEILGAIIAYDGAELIQLRSSFLDYLAQHHQFNDIHPEAETEAGEFYIDTLSVYPKAQGLGIGKSLIKQAILFAQNNGFHQIGLLVEKENLSAKRLYSSLNFSIVEEKKFMGDQYFHMVYPTA